MTSYKSLFAYFILTSLTAFAAPQFDKKFDAYTKANGPGFAAMVVKDGKTIYAKGFGFASLKRNAKTRITPETNFNLASNSKQFTAMAILLLEQQGKISADDFLSKFIPEIPEYMKPIKIRHFIYHTSGLPDYMEVCEEKPKVFNADILAALYKKEKLEFPAGSKHEYSNSGYVVLSEVVQRVSGVAFPDFIRREIFEKLGMKDSWVFSVANEPKVLRRAVGYGKWPFLDEDDFSPCNYNFGDGGVYTSLVDYAKWLRFLENPAVLLKGDFQKKFFEFGKTDSGESTEYAYGWGLSSYAGMKMMAHSGSWVGFRSFAGFLPEKKVWAVVFSNYKGIGLNEMTLDLLEEFTK